MLRKDSGPCAFQGYDGCVAEPLKAPDCKTGLERHGGSNPSAPTRSRRRQQEVNKELKDIIETTREAWGLGK